MFKPELKTISLTGDGLHFFYVDGVRYVLVEDTIWLVLGVTGYVVECRELTMRERTDLLCVLRRIHNEDMQ